MAALHELKTWPEFFEAVVSEQKRFEVRKDDRGFRVGDTLLLREWSPSTGEYSGRISAKRVDFVLTGGQFGVESGHAVLSLGEIRVFEYDAVMKRVRELGGRMC